MKRNNFLSELFSYLWKRKAYWLFPVILFLVLLIGVIFLGTSPTSVFVYPFF